MNNEIENNNLNEVPIDEESDKILLIINEFKKQNISNNIDFEKAEKEKLEIENRNNFNKNTTIKENYDEKCFLMGEQYDIYRNEK